MSSTAGRNPKKKKKLKYKRTLQQQHRKAQKYKRCNTTFHGMCITKKSAVRKSEQVSEKCQQLPYCCLQQQLQHRFTTFDDKSGMSICATPLLKR